jgi:hypothetical protein
LKYVSSERGNFGTTAAIDFSVKADGAAIAAPAASGVHKSD